MEQCVIPACRTEIVCNFSKSPNKLICFNNVTDAGVYLFPFTMVPPGVILW